MTKLDAYIDRVTAVLADEFDWDDGIAEAFRSTFAPTRGQQYEFICDSPVSARWRLKHHHDHAHPWALRMAYYGDNPDKQEREDAITKRLTEALP